MIIKIEEIINNDNIEIKEIEYFIKILIIIDLLYNIIIYEKYEIEFSFE